ncbi:MAG: hypothetical protein ABI359_00605, partial [Ginsengibacter sp.]
TPITEKVKLPGTTDSVYLSDISITGGELNAYNALKLASTLKGERTKTDNGMKSDMDEKGSKNRKKHKKRD